MEFRLHYVLFTFLLVIGACEPLAAQEHEDPEKEALLKRLRILEEQAAARDLKIKTLEARLEQEELATASDSELETMINGLVAEEGPKVTAPRSQMLKFSGQARFQAEFRDVRNYSGLENENTDFIFERIRLNADFRVLDHVRVFLQLADTRFWGEAGSPVGDLQGTDMRLAFVDFEEVFGHPWTIRVGRQAIIFGDQRLVSTLDWHPVGFSFDGVRTWWEEETFRVDAFAFNVREGTAVPGQLAGIPGKEAGDDDYFSGLYFSYKGIENHEIDAYVFYRSYSATTFTGENGSTGDLDEWTMGLRFAGKAGGFHYAVEGVYQAGEQADDDINAFGVAVKFGYTFDASWRPHIWIEYTFASGDDDPTDGDFETFNPLFPFGHFYHGYADVFSWRNGHGIALRSTVDPTDSMQLAVDFHVFILDSDTDAWYGANSRPIRRVAGGVSNYVGSEIDVHMRYKLNPATNLWIGYSHFFAGDYVDDTGKSPDTDFVYFQMTVSF